MGYYNNEILSRTADDAALDRRDGPPVLTPRQRRLDPTIALAAPFRAETYAIYYCPPIADPATWTKKHGGSFATYEQALRALKRLGWLHGNGHASLHHPGDGGHAELSDRAGAAVRAGNLVRNWKTSL